MGLSLAFAPFPFRFLAFGAFVPLLHLIEQRPKRLFLWAWLFGTLAAAFHLWWIWFLLVPVETVTRILLNIGVAVLFAYLGLYIGIFAILVRRTGIWSAPLLLPLLEFLRSKFQIAFPWDLLGYTMTPWVPFIQIAALGGVYLLSAWVMLINLFCYRLLFRPGRLWSVLALLLAFLLPLLYARLHIRPNRPWFLAGIIQPNVSPLDKGDWAARERIQTDLIRLTRAARCSTAVDLVIYPETATLVDVTRSTSIGPALHRLADSLDLEIFTGTPIYDETHHTWHNGAVLIRPEEEPIAQRYYKMRLVPFSEKIPYSDELPFLRRLIGTSDMGNWDRGWHHTVFNFRHGRLSGLICFEAIFPDLTREFVRRGSELLVVVTNDGWFGRLPGAYQHAELAIMRTVELGVPMVRSANNGISYVVDPFGRVLKRTGLFTQAILTGSVPRPLSSTPYRRYGDWFILFCLAGLVVIIVKRAAARRKKAPG
ncbi:MAG: apolipoprotein N-acyltransferase [candidate division WOR-3 bacterium]